MTLDLEVTFFLLTEFEQSLYFCSKYDYFLLLMNDFGLSDSKCLKRLILEGCVIFSGLASARELERELCFVYMFSLTIFRYILQICSSF